MKSINRLRSLLASQSEILLPFDTKGLDCLIDADILKLLSEDSPSSSAGNFEGQDFLAYDDYMFQDALRWDV
ncbi:hypothetical protein N7493_002636 [Penicillium malachiteum]|uniref:Uncharacterized protein n=1 Tax=Penicillium malachiteum TaxID=1324776 RepID=A0AAD6HSK7_9EURO|nr:hypothetical protein N7493_002636 [Penicillium malachiteum]